MPTLPLPHGTIQLCHHSDPLRITGSPFVFFVPPRLLPIISRRPTRSSQRVLRPAARSSSMVDSCPARYCSAGPSSAGCLISAIPPPMGPGHHAPLVSLRRLSSPSSCDVLPDHVFFQMPSADRLRFDPVSRGTPTRPLCVRGTADTQASRSGPLLPLLRFLHGVAVGASMDCARSLQTLCSESASDLVSAGGERVARRSRARTAQGRSIRECIVGAVRALRILRPERERVNGARGRAEPAKVR